ncbi:dTMP kinase, partial [Klebsiella oxytoca]
MEGIFISVEGPDGAGKSTVVQGLVSLLEASFKKQVLQTREPGGSMIAEEI